MGHKKILTTIVLGCFLILNLVFSSSFNFIDTCSANENINIEKVKIFDQKSSTEKKKICLGASTFIACKLITTNNFSFYINNVETLIEKENLLNKNLYIYEYIPDPGIPTTLKPIKDWIPFLIDYAITVEPSIYFYIAQMIGYPLQYYLFKDMYYTG